MKAKAIKNISTKYFEEKCNITAKVVINLFSKSIDLPSTSVKTNLANGSFLGSAVKLLLLT